MTRREGPTLIEQAVAARPDDPARRARFRDVAVVVLAARDAGRAGGLPTWPDELDELLRPFEDERGEGDD